MQDTYRNWRTEGHKRYRPKANIYNIINDNNSNDETLMKMIVDGLIMDVITLLTLAIL